MPPTASVLQAQYPLSPRKFWKKLIDKFVFVILLFILFSLLGLPVAAALLRTNDLGSLAGMSVTFAGLFSLLILILYAWYVKAYIRRYFYDANDTFVTIRKGVFAPAEIHVQYAKIQDVYVDQDIIDRMMGLYDVHLASATVMSGMEAHIDGVDFAAAEGLKNLLLGMIRQGGSSPAQGAMPGAIPAAPISGPVSFNQEISSATYPVVGRWIILETFITLFLSLLVAGYAAFRFSVPSNGNTTSISDSIGIGGFSIFLIVFVIFYAYFFLKAVLWRHFYTYAFLPDYIVEKSGIIAKTETHIPYRTVQDVSVTQGVIERLLGLSTIVIQNAAQSGLGANKISFNGSGNTMKIPGQPRAKATEISEALKAILMSYNTTGTGL